MAPCAGLCVIVSRFCGVQLSLDCALTSAVTSGTGAEHLLSTLADCAGTWQATAGTCISIIVTVNDAGAEVLPELSVAVQVTVVTPFAKVEPATGLQTGARFV